MAHYGRLHQDPLRSSFFSSFGRSPAPCRFPVFPPRKFDFGNFPAVDAVFLTHEHEDHFNIPSLNCVDRSIPVYLSSRSSSAASAALKKMGFVLRSFSPGRPIPVGKLSVYGFQGQYGDHSPCDEWDTLAFLAFSNAGNGFFFSPVDIPLNVEMFEKIIQISRFMEKPPEASGHPTGFLVHNHRVLNWKAPADFKISSAGGPGLFSQSGLELSPGLTVSFDHHGVVGVEKSTPFLKMPSNDVLPERKPWFFLAESGDYPPICGKRKIQESEMRRLRRKMTTLAEFLYGSGYFKNLLSLDLENMRDRIPTVAFSLRNGKTNLVMEYDRGSCRFVVSPVKNPHSRYMTTFECWASDLLSIFDGAFEVRALTLGKCRTWTTAFEEKTFIVQVLWPFFHPLRWPQKYLNGYLKAASRLQNQRARAIKGNNSKSPEEERDGGGAGG